MLHSLPSAVRAQVVSASGLKILILDGEGAVNSIKLGTAREPIVQVQDENDRPVAGAMVVFTLPEGDISAIGSVSVTLSNQEGTSAQFSASF
jgi:hypothetical protein